MSVIISINNAVLTVSRSHTSVPGYGIQEGQTKNRKKRTVADLVGHSDTSFLERVYCHPQLESKEQAAKVFGESAARRNGS